MVWTGIVFSTPNVPAMADPPSTTPSQPPNEVSDETLLLVIADFLALGHVDNIVAMVRQEPRYLAWTGQLIEDGRYAVRLGVAVLFECLTTVCPESLSLAVPGLIEQLGNPLAWVRGEAASVLGAIATDEALAALPPLLRDPSPQVVEVVRDILDCAGNG
ncbi:MAG: HEAT repeat domain-containing protein [Desulfobulbus sp.]|nr:HEAT repeat domain-containing protein [Desulfobulbus sp.]